MIGVTLASPKFADLASEAVKRFTRFTGLPAVAVTTAVDKNYTAKFSLWKMFKDPAQTVVFFDADLWFIRPASLEHLRDRTELIAVQDPGVRNHAYFPAHDAKVLGIELERYFNSGFFIWNKRHWNVFTEAEQIARTYGNSGTAPHRLHDFGEQSALNAAVQRNASLRLVSNVYNYMPYAEIRGEPAYPIQREPKAIHAVGHNRENGSKQQALEHFEQVYTDKYGTARYRDSD